MKISEQYAAEFKPGGKRACQKCERRSHGKFCSFCINKELLWLGVSSKTLRIASSVFRNPKTPERFEQAIEAIDKELKE